MGFGDVLSGKQSLGGWLTGRDVKESDLYVDIDKAEATIDEINNIANTIPSAGSAVSGALSALNSVNGMALIGGFQLGNVEAAFDQITAQVKNVASQMDKRVGDAKYYSSSTWDKIWGTAGMVVAKAGEGFLGAFEDIGDGVVSVVGWVGGKLGADTQWAEDFVSKDWSHDVMDWAYYSRDISKYSAFTEDSAIAGACEIAGKAAGYMYAGGMFNGLTGLKALEAGKVATSASRVGKAVQGVGKLALKLGSSSTMSATAVAALGGFGSGTETGLYEGKSFNDAFTQNGLRAAGTNALLAYAGGKWGEHRAVVKGSGTTRSAVKSKGMTREQVKLARETFKATATPGTIQGYSDAFTKAGERFGEGLHDTIGGGLKLVGSGAKNIVTKGGNAANVQAAKQQLGSGLKQVATQNPVSQLVTGTARSLTNGVGSATGLGGKALQVGKNIATTPIKAGAGVVQALATPGGVAMTVSAAGKQATNETAADQFRETGIVTPDRETPTGVPQVTGGPAIPDNPADQIINGGGTQTGTQPDPVVTQPPVSDPPTTQPPLGDGGPPGSGGPGTETPKVTTPTVTPPSVSIEVPTQPQVTTPVVEPTYPQPTQTVVETPTTVVDTPTGGAPASEHFGGGYSATGGFDGETEPELSDLDAVKTSIDDIIKGNKYSKIPTSAKPIAKAQAGSTGSTVIPLSAGLSAAAAVGLGAKAYLDKKTRSDEEEEEDIERWQGEGSVDLAPEKVEEDPLLDESNGETLQSRILESVTGESYSDL